MESFYVYPLFLNGFLIFESSENLLYPGPNACVRPFVISYHIEVKSTNSGITTYKWPTKQLSRVCVQTAKRLAQTPPLGRFLSFI